MKCSVKMAQYQEQKIENDGWCFHNIVWLYGLHSRREKKERKCSSLFLAACDSLPRNKLTAKP